MATAAGTSRACSAAAAGLTSSSELFFFGGAGERGDGRLARLHGLRDLVEVTGADLALVTRRSVPLRFGRELGLLQLHVGRHVLRGVAARQVEHAVVERVESRQGDELELVAHGAELALELGDGGVVEVLLPVERGRAVVGE